MARNDFRFSHRLRVRWSDCDAQGIAFSGAYFAFIEAALAAYFRNLGVALYHPDGMRHFDTAIVKATLEYISPARADDVIDVCWRVARIGNTSFTALSEMYDSLIGGLLLKAEIVYVDFDSEAATARPVPADMRRLIETYEATGEIIPLADLPGLRGLRPPPPGRH